MLARRVHGSCCSCIVRVTKSARLVCIVFNPTVEDCSEEEAEVSSGARRMEDATLDCFPKSPFIGGGFVPALLALSTLVEVVAGSLEKLEAVAEFASVPASSSPRA